MSSAHLPWGQVQSLAEACRQSLSELLAFAFPFIKEKTVDELPCALSTGTGQYLLTNSHIMKMKHGFVDKFDKYL